MTNTQVSLPDAFAGRDKVLEALEVLLDDLRARGIDSWENRSVESYLEALCALVGSIENAYDNLARERPTDPWQVIADALEGARYYE